MECGERDRLQQDMKRIQELVNNHQKKQLELEWEKRATTISKYDSARQPRLFYKK